MADRDLAPEPAERHTHRPAPAHEAATTAPPSSTTSSAPGNGTRSPARRRLSGARLRSLQRSAGNRAVASLVAQRRVPAVRGTATGAGTTTGMGTADGTVARSPAEPASAASGPGASAGVAGPETAGAAPPGDQVRPTVARRTEGPDGPDGGTAVRRPTSPVVPHPAGGSAPRAPRGARSPGGPRPLGGGGGRVVVQRRRDPQAGGAGGAGGATAGTGGGAKADAGVGDGAEGRREAEADPKFKKLQADVHSKQKAVASSHPPASTEASSAQGAAKAPPDDKVAQGKAANAEKMHAAKPGTFDKAGFIRAVNEAIAAQAPKNLDEADKFGESGKADAVKGQVQGQVAKGKDASAQQIETTTKAPPDTSAAKEKPVTPMGQDRPPAAPGTPDPALAVPDKAPAAATDFSAGPAQVDQTMADAQVTDDQLARANEPEFSTALKEKKQAEQHAATAPGQVRAGEARTLTQARAHATQAGTAAMGSLAADRRKAGQAVQAGKEGAKSDDEAKRAQVTARLQKVFDATKADVEKILSGLDAKVDEKFTSGEKAARDAFTAEHKRRMDAYKDERYSGLTGKARWVKDKFAGLPSEANQIFVEARKGYVARMQTVISAVADVIGAELDKAKARIATGRKELQDEVRKLPADLRAIGKEAAGDFTAKFDELNESVDAKGEELVQTLATKYNDALKAVDAEIEAEKEKNKGLVAKAVDAVKGVVDTILQLKDMLLGVLAKAASAVMAILKDPIGFLGKLVSAVGAGLKAFMRNIGKHLQAGLLGWLLGAMAAAGLTLPASFDLKGIIVLIGSLLGLTWAAIRGRVVKKGVPEPAMEAVERSVPVAQKLQSEGIGGIWQEIKAKVGDLKATLFSKISQFLIPTVLIAGITWILSLLNPASAFIKACKMIIDIVTFIVNQGAQIVEFVNAVLDAVIAIAGGGAAGVAGLVENALGRSIPVLIGALAAILGIGGIAGKIQKFVRSLAKPVGKAVDFVVDKIVKLGKKLWAKLKSKFGKKGKGKDKDKDQRAEEVDVPRRLVEPSPLNVDKVDPALGQELQQAQSGQVIHSKGGDPKSVAKQIVAQHGDARYDKASGTLTLPATSRVSPGSSLAALGANVAQATGVSQVTIEKKGEETEVWASVNPKVRVAKIEGLPEADALVRIAVTQQGLVPFLKSMAAGQSMTVTQGAVSGAVNLSILERAWANQETKDWLKNKFRDLIPGHHEWVPSNYILEVVKRAQDLAGEGPKWIDLQHELRSETFRIVYAPAKAPPEIVKDKLPGEDQQREFSVPSGHVGAVYFRKPGSKRGGEKTAGSETFHNELRTGFSTGTTVKQVAQNALAVAKAWAWNGTPMTPDIHPDCRDKDGNQVTPARQKANYAAIEAHFAPFV